MLHPPIEPYDTGWLDPVDYSAIAHAPADLQLAAALDRLALAGRSAPLERDVGHLGTGREEEGHTAAGAAVGHRQRGRRDHGVVRQQLDCGAGTGRQVAWQLLQRQVQAQRRRRRFLRHARRPKGKEQSRMPPGAGLQASDLLRPGLGQPTEHGGHTMRLQCLLCGPQTLCRTLYINADHAIGAHPRTYTHPLPIGHARGSPRGAVRRMRCP